MAIGTATLINDNVPAEGSCTMNSEVYRNILSAQVPVNASKLIRRHFTLLQDNAPGDIYEMQTSSGHCMRGIRKEVLNVSALIFLPMLCPKLYGSLK